MKYEENYQPSDHPYEPDYDLNQFLDTQFDANEKATLWRFLERLMQTTEPMQLIIDSKNPDHYAGQRGFFYLLDWALSEVPEMENSSSMHEEGVFNADYDYNFQDESVKRVADPAAENIYRIKSHLVLTPDIMMTNAHFVQMVHRLAKDLTKILRRFQNRTVKLFHALGYIESSLKTIL